MDYEASDILASSELPHLKPEGWTVPAFLTLPVLATTFVIFWALLYARNKFMRWQEASYRKAMRRRYGIPDSDNRPFNVAYAAAVRARKDREAQEWLEAEEASAAAAEKSHHRAKLQHRNALLEGHDIRKKASDTGTKRQSVAFAQPPVQQYIVNTTAFEPKRSQHPNGSANGGIAYSSVPRRVTLADPLNFADRYKPGIPLSSAPPLSQVPTSTGTVGPRGPKHLDLTPKAPEPEARKHTLEQDDELEQRWESKKKSRVEGDQLIDGDEEAGWDDQLGGASKMIGWNDEDLVQLPKRGSKRGASPEDDEKIQNARPKEDKRARKVSRDKTTDSRDQEEQADMDVDADLGPIARGKKRDRTEAGSTIADEDSSPRAKASRRSKRRTLSRKDESDDHARGQKRDRDTESSITDDEELEHQRVRRSRKRRDEQSTTSGDSDIHMDDGDVSEDPLCQGRRIGEEWEVNGRRYKVGPNGRRLRQELVKKLRTKFVMPKDSEHPDVDAHMDVVIETWLTEEQYKAAKERQELAWQDSRKNSEEPNPPLEVQGSPSKGGKALLWSSPQKNAALSKRGPFRQSVATNVGLHINPFEQSRTSSGRRVASAYNGSMPPPSETPKLRSARSFSKWEKQDLEAESIAKMRQRLQEQRQALSPDKKVAFELPPSSFTPQSNNSTAIPHSSTPSVPLSFSLPKPGETSGMRSVTTPAAFTPTTTDASKGASSSKESSTTVPTFKPPESSVSAPSDTTPSSQATGAFAWPPPASRASTDTNGDKQPSSLPPSATPSTTPFSFAQSSQQSAPPSTSQLPSATSFFGPKSDASGPPFIMQESASSTISTPSTLQGATQQQMAATGGLTSNAPKVASSPFNFPTNNSSQATSTSPFAFGNRSTFTTSTQPSVTKTEQTPTQSSVPSAGPSLLSRLAPLPNATTTPSSLPSGGPSGATTPVGTAVFAESYKSTSPWQGASSQPSTTTNVAGPPAPKFNFGFSSKPTTATPTSSAAAPPAAEVGKVPGTTTGPTTFNFGNTASNNQGFGAPTASKLNFNAGSSSLMSAFGKQNDDAQSTTTTNTSSSPFKFGTPAASIPSSTTPTSVSQQGEATKSVFSFGNAGTSGSSPAMVAPQSKPTFNFNFGSSVAPSTGTPTPSAFGTQSAGSQFGQSAFGQSSSSAFSFGKPSLSASTPFTFGAAPSAPSGETDKK